MKKLFLLLILCGSISVNAQTDNFKKTDEVLSEVVKKALLVAEKTGDFVVEQSPLVLQEFYAWHIWSSIIFIFFGFLLIFSGIRIPYLWLSKEKLDDWDTAFFKRYGGDDGVIAAWVFFATFCAVGVVFILENAYDLTHILVAPKLYLIEYFTK